MDQKKKIILALLAIVAVAFPKQTVGQNVGRFILMDKQYQYTLGNDSITVFFNIFDIQGERQWDLSPDQLSHYLVLKEDGKIVQENSSSISVVHNGKRIPSDYTFSVLVDLNIPQKGKDQIAKLVGTLVESAPDSCVYLSFFGDVVSPTQIVTMDSYSNSLPLFHESTRNKYFYSALYAKLSEFSTIETRLDSYVKEQSGYEKNRLIGQRAIDNPDKNILFVFTEGHRRPTPEESISFLEVSDYQSSDGIIVPTVYAFYYTEDGSNPDISLLLEAICTPKDHPERNGNYMPANNIEQVMRDFEQVVSERSYDYAFTYKAFDKTYTGKTLFQLEWKGEMKGEGSFSIGSPERPWPEKVEGVGNFFVKFLMALLLALLVSLFFFFIMKVIIPITRSWLFERKYYKEYVPEENVKRRLCHYCGREIEPGQTIVVRCKHIMHVSCWIQNNYRCSEYGQNCKDGIQMHVHWKELFTKNTLREGFQTLSGIGAALVAWLVYELGGRGGFKSLSEWIVGFTLKDGLQESIYFDCAVKTSTFLMIGLLLGFFLSLVFRYNDEYRNKDWKVLLKIIGLSLLSGLVGMIAFAFGAIILCLIVTISGTTFVPWIASLPAYILFALSMALILSWKSSIPLKSALLGGGIASIIGFLVLFSTMTSQGWINILLNFIIYGGGLGASIVTVRMLSEHYFLVIQNGIRARQRIPIHKWMNATGGGNKVSIGMTGECEIQMNWEKSNKVAKEHARLYIDREKNLPVIKPMATGVQFNSRAELPVGKPCILTNGDTFKIGDTIFKYDESE